MPDALSLSRTELPEEIEKAIITLCRAEGSLGNLSLTGRNYQRAMTAAYEAREALTAAILSRLGEVEAAEKELATLRRVHRWNVEHSDGEVLVCRNNHDKGEDCDWERFVPEERLTAAIARVERLEKALRFTDGVVTSFLEWLQEDDPSFAPPLPIALAMVDASQQRQAALSEAPPQGEQ